MKNLRIIQFLKTFDKKEMKDFEKFVASPFFNKGRNYLPLLKEIGRFHPDFNSGKMTREYIYSRLYPGKKYSEKTMKNMNSALVGLAEEYIVQIKSRERKINYYITLADELQDRKMFQLSEKAYENSMKLLEKSGFEPYYFYNSFMFWRTKTYFYQLSGAAAKNIDVLSKEYTYFIYYVISMFSLITEKTYVYKYNINAVFDVELMKKFVHNFEDVIRHLKEKNYELSGIILLYYNIIKMFLNEFDENVYYEIKKTFKDNIEKFSRIQKFRMYATLHNAIARLSVLDNKKYLMESFALFKDMAQFGLLNIKPGAELNIDLITSIVKVALNVEEYDWLKKFIEDHIDKVPLKFRKCVYNYAHANLCFENRDFSGAQEYLMKVKQETFSFKYDTKVLLLKIYYELKYLEEARSLADSFKHFVSENKSVSEEKKPKNSNFVKFCSELLKCAEENNMFEAGQLKTKLLNTDQCRSKEWLLEKIDELEKNK